MFVLSVSHSYLTLAQYSYQVESPALRDSGDGVVFGVGGWGGHNVFSVTEEALSAALAAIRHLDPRTGGADPSGSISKNDLAPLNLYGRFITPGPRC